MEAPAELAGRLRQGLDQLNGRAGHGISSAHAWQLADLANSRSEQLSLLPEEVRHLLHTADIGFAATGQWVTEADTKQDQAVHGIVQGLADGMT